MREGRQCARLLTLEQVALEPAPRDHDLPGQAHERVEAVEVDANAGTRRPPALVGARVRGLGAERGADRLEPGARVVAGGRGPPRPPAAPPRPGGPRPPPPPPPPPPPAPRATAPR